MEIGNQVIAITGASAGIDVATARLVTVRGARSRTAPREATWRGLWPRSRKAAGTLSPAGPTSRGPRAANSSFDLAVEVSVGSMSSWPVRGWPRAACFGQPGQLERDDRPEPRGVLYGIQRPYQRSPPRGQATSPPSRRRQPLSGCHLGGYTRATRPGVVNRRPSISARTGLV
jgi:hypothetical protein